MTDVFRVGVSQRLRAGRRQAKLTQEDVAKQVHVTRQAVSGWECGASLPTIDQFMVLGILYGLSLDSLVYGVRELPAELRRMMDRRDSEETRPPVARG